MTAILASILPVLLPALGSLVTAGLGLLTLTINNKIKADTAWKKLAQIGSGLVGKAWDAAGAKLQAALADGKVTAAERDDIISTLLGVLTTEDQAAIQGVADAVKLPFSSIIATLANNFIDTWAKAHDPANAEVSKLAFPVAGSNLTVESGAVGSFGG